MSDKVFADGFSFKRRDNAPDFVIGKLSIKVEDAIPFIKGHARNGWVNLNVLTASSGKPYVELDTFVPKPQNTENKQAEVQKAETEDLPF
tara:strand:- start:1464 stop:1733 length:270 start_codon:yes stop_codon:yes gene_type:complete